MLDQQHIAHFRAFGFVVLRGLLSREEVAVLRAEVRTALADAFGGIGTDDDPDGTGGIRGDYLPLSVDRAPLSQALIADDPRLYQGSSELLGSPTVPTAPLATCFTSNAGWHTDQGPDVGGVKFLAHLQPRAGRSGALRVVPGSHHPGYATRLAAYRALDPACQGLSEWPWPCEVLTTRPGDVVAFDLHLLHSSVGGTRRLAWSIEYFPWPGLADPGRCRAVGALVTDASNVDDGRYDPERWPTWREWVRGAPASASRATAVQRLRLLGVLSDADVR